MADGLRTILCERLGCRYPIVQTAMGWVADARLTAATCNAGGFGFLAAATLGQGEVEPEILKLKSLTDRPFGVNFHMFQPNAEEVISLVIKHRVKAVSYGRGPDAKTIARLKQADVVCMPTVGALKHAVKAVELGADITALALLDFLWEQVEGERPAGLPLLPVRDVALVGRPSVLVSLRPVQVLEEDVVLKGPIWVESPALPG